MIIEFKGERGGSVYTDDQGPGYNYRFQVNKNGRKFLRCIYRPVPKHERVHKAVCKGRGSFKLGEEHNADAKILISPHNPHTCKPDPLLPKVGEAKQALWEYAAEHPTLTAQEIYAAVSQRYSVEIMARILKDSVRRSINRKKNKHSPAKPKAPREFELILQQESLTPEHIIAEGDHGYSRTPDVGASAFLEVWQDADLNTYYTTATTTTTPTTTTSTTNEHNSTGKVTKNYDAFCAYIGDKLRNSPPNVAKELEKQILAVLLRVSD